MLADTVSEFDISSTINDFATFCTYLEEKKPKLSRAREELGKKGFAINDDHLYAFFMDGKLWSRNTWFI